MFYWFEPVLYLDPVSNFPETTGRPGYVVGFADNVEDTLTFKILKKDLTTVLHRSVVRSAADANHRNKRVSFKPDVQEMIEKLDTTSYNAPRRNLPKQKTRKQNEDVASRTRSKFGRTDQNVADKTKSKLQAICNSSSKELFFPLYNAVMLKGQENWKNVDVPFHLGASECLIYQSALMKPKSQSELDWLCQLHVLDKTEDDLDESCECTKVIKYCEDSGMDMSTNHNCLAEWDDMNKSQSWVNFFALYLSNPTPVILFARKHNLLDKMPF
jgi:hypothetical protein